MFYRFIKKYSLFVLSIVYFIGSQAQSNVSLTASEVFFKVQKMQITGSVLYIAAHPDDENTRLLSYLSNERKYRTAYLSLTRGDGGQNLIGKEQGSLLGIIRSNELIQARKRDGGEQFFSRAFDFGYSKTPEETLKIWDKEQVLADMVWTIRNFKPDVIICRFPTTGEGGHGHHTASAILAMEAFDLAADSNAYKYQLKFTQTWKTRRMFWNTFNFGTVNTTAENQIKINVGTYNAMLGKSCGEIAAESRTMHKSQGFGTAGQRGNSYEYFKLMKGDSVRSDIFEGINTSWSKIKNATAIEKQIVGLQKSFNWLQLDKNLPALLKVYQSLMAIKDPNQSSFLTYKINELKSIIKYCMGLHITATTKENSVTNNQNFAVNYQIIARNSGQAILEKMSFMGKKDTLFNVALKSNEPLIYNTIASVNALEYSNPYWLNLETHKPLTDINNMQKLLLPANSASLFTNVTFKVLGTAIDFEIPVENKTIDPTKGELKHPVFVLPAAVFTRVKKSQILNNTNTLKMQLTIIAQKDNLKGTLNFEPNEQTKISIENPTFENMKKGEEKTFNIVVELKTANAAIKLEPYLSIDGQKITETLVNIDYDHIGPQIYIEKTVLDVHPFSIKMQAKNIAYIMGAGDNVPDALKQLGYNVSIIDEQQIKTIDLNQFSAIICGIRAYNVNDYLQNTYPILMEYIKKGGNLIVQYNTNSRVGPLSMNIGPYPFNISRERITDETTAVYFLNNEHSIFKYPNIITNNDFEGWVQERGIYFAEKLDSNYQTFLSMADPGEQPKTGALIIGKYGKGNFIYTGLAFFRQLPNGVEGACKLFTNLIELPNN